MTPKPNARIGCQPIVKTTPRIYVVRAKSRSDSSALDCCSLSSQDNMRRPLGAIYSLFIADDLGACQDFTFVALHQPAWANALLGGIRRACFSQRLNLEATARFGGP
jgi:hypothetical protein